uniref:Uncharacterized protein n=1 Tax=Leersia perrieri TaxID=77586 RepID=A0A0D9WMP2_9ORYZ
MARGAVPTGSAGSTRLWPTRKFHANGTSPTSSSSSHMKRCSTVPMTRGPLIHGVTVLEQCHISPTPAPAAAQSRSLPLTFFDLVFWDFPPVQRLFFYDNTDIIDVPEFLLRELPLFKDSLAAALHHFYPLAGKLPCRIQECASPEVVYSDGDSVRLTTAVSSDDFQDLADDHPRDTARLRPLLPPLMQEHGDTQAVFAVQVTVFPRAGICVGTTLHHAVADGSSYVHFLKTWTAIHRLGSTTPPPPPLFDRSVVRDGTGLRESFIEDLLEESDDDSNKRRTQDVVLLATFRFTDELLLQLGRHVESETSVSRCSPYALACGAAWAGIVHARGGGGGGDKALFGFVTGCKPRTSPPIPSNYFGNCLGLCFVEAAAEGTRLLTAASASAAIWRVIEGLAEDGRALRDARGWVRGAREYVAARAVTVAGSPKLGVYAAADLGARWGGRPRKVEIVSVERTGALALAESGRGGEGGIEVGVALPRVEMEAFRAFHIDLVRAAPRAHSLGRQRRHVLGVAAVEQHHGRPVLARVGRLHGAVHLGRLRGPIVVVHAQHGVAWVGITGHEFGDVGDEEEVAVDEERPAAVAGEVRGEEAGEGEFGAFRGAALAPVQTRRPELLLDDRDHGERHGGATQQ